MKRRDFLKIVAASAVGAVVPLPKVSKALVGHGLTLVGSTVGPISNLTGNSGGFIVPEHIAKQIFERIYTVRNPVRIVPTMPPRTRKEPQ